MSFIKKLKNNKFLIFSTLLIMIGILLMLSNIYQSNQELIIERNSIEYFFVEENEENEVTNEEEIIKTVYNYNIILEIPKIDLIKGIFSIGSIYNNVSKNVEIMEYSNMPNEYGNVVLASHSGTSSVAYFNDLKDLVINDVIYLYYEDVKYIYEVIDIYTIEKNGMFDLENDSISNVYLITCVTGTNYQLVVKGSLKAEETY